MSVVGPVCGGIVTTIPSAGFTPVRTSQNARLLRVPVPSAAGHVRTAGAYCNAGCAGGRVAGREGRRA